MRPALTAARWTLAAVVAAAVLASEGCEKHGRIRVWTAGVGAAPATTFPALAAPVPAAVLRSPAAAIETVHFAAAGSAVIQAPMSAADRPATAAAAPGAFPTGMAQPARVPDGASEGVEVLARGPVHEAFAEPVVADPSPGIVVREEPPAPVPEMPPDERPPGAIWIPGYWALDGERNEFIWVSGIWRVPPPGCRWVPGYWVQVAEGWQWVPGFWLPESAGQVEYLPAPPASLEVGPVGVVPSADCIWVPGCWVRVGSIYAWRAGFWAPAQPSWIWVPAHYVWTPRGCVFVDGYWDYVLEARGILFAPVRFVRPLWVQPAYVFTPDVVIRTDCLTVALFFRPRYVHYYFGDYFDGIYVGVGIVPWYECRVRRGWYDPIYVHAAWQNRHDPRWHDRLREHYEHLRLDPAARPPRTFAAQAHLARSGEQTVGADIRPPVALAAPLKDAAGPAASAVRLEKPDAPSRAAIADYAERLRAYRAERAVAERGTGEGGPLSDARKSANYVPAPAGISPRSGSPVAGPGVFPRLGSDDAPAPRPLSGPALEVRRPDGPPARVDASRPDRPVRPPDGDKPGRPANPPEGNTPGRLLVLPGSSEPGRPAAPPIARPANLPASAPAGAVPAAAVAGGPASPLLAPASAGIAGPVTQPVEGPRVVPPARPPRTEQSRAGPAIAPVQPPATVRPDAAPRVAPVKAAGAEQPQAALDVAPGEPQARDQPRAAPRVAPAWPATAERHRTASGVAPVRPAGDEQARVAPGIPQQPVPAVRPPAAVLPAEARPAVRPLSPGMSARDPVGQQATEKVAPPASRLPVAAVPAEVRPAVRPLPPGVGAGGPPAPAQPQPEKSDEKERRR